MSYGFNRVTLFGNLGADPDLRFTQGGQAVLNMRVACTESYLDRDKNRKERTEWVSVVVWGKRAEALAKLVSKGSSVFIEGSLHTSSYDDREGNKRYKTEVNAREVILAGGKREGGERREQREEPAADHGFGGGGGHGGALGDDDIPFITSVPNECGL